MKVVLQERDGSGGVWIDNAPDGARSLAVIEHTEYVDTGETINDKTWGQVRVFREVSHWDRCESVKIPDGPGPHPITRPEAFAANIVDKD